MLLPAKWGVNWLFYGTVGLQMSESGTETLTADGTAGHFLLTYLLLEMLVSSAPSRVVTVSSKGHKYGRLDVDDVNVKRRWSAFKAYCRSKTANVLLSTHLARLLQGDSDCRRRLLACFARWCNG